MQVSWEAGKVVWYSRLFQNFPQFIVIHTDESFGIVSKAEVGVFLGEDNGTPLQYSCLENPMDGGALFIGEGNDNPLQCSCLENPRNRGAWWAAVYGVA